MMKQITLALFTIYKVSYSFAFTPLHPISIIQKIKTPNETLTKNIQNDFIDFSGTWKGNCIFKDYETKETVIIKNTAQYIDFGNKRFLIGNSLYSESNTSPQATYFDHKQVEWSQDGKSLSIQGTKVVGANLDKPLTTYLFTDIMSLINNQIVISIKIKGFQNIEVVVEDEGNCILDRI